MCAKFVFLDTNLNPMPVAITITNLSEPQAVWRTLHGKQTAHGNRAGSAERSRAKNIRFCSSVSHQ
jgi:hypothetical protein